MKNFSISKIGINLIKNFESLSLEPYVCIGGYLTIGYGHKIQNPRIFYPKKISLEQAHELLVYDVAIAERAVRNNIKIALLQNQFDALTSFTFNVGSGALQRSTLRQKINQELFNEIEEEFLKWTYCKGKKIKGILIRRKIESELFLNKLGRIKLESIKKI